MKFRSLFQEFTRLVNNAKFIVLSDSVSGHDTLW